MKPHPIWPVVIIASALGAAALGLSDSPLRPLVTTWFLLVCPGLAVVPLVGRREAWVDIILAIAVSLGLNTVVAEAMLLLGVWSPRAGLGLLILVSLAGAALQLIRLRGPAPVPGTRS